MKSRHRARGIALQILYQYDLAPEGPKPSESHFIQDLTRYFEHFRIPEELREFISELVVGTFISTKKLDQILEKHTLHWRVERLSSVDRCLLRMALYELMHFPNTARAIVIDEAIELAKEFGTQDTQSFVNGVLDKIDLEAANIAPIPLLKVTQTQATASAM